MGGNRIRYLLGMQQAISLKVFITPEGGSREEAATVQETNKGTPSIRIVGHANGTKSGDDIVIADSKLDIHAMAQNGERASWYLQNHKSNDLPYYVISAITLLYAFHYQGAV